MRSKEDLVLNIFFENPTKEWHFEEIVKEVKIARSKTDYWLKIFIRQGLIRRVKEKGRMPHYISNYTSPEYKSRKKMYAQKTLYESGFLKHLLSLTHAKAIILFGSFMRSDWYYKSDIDLFVYGNIKGLKVVPYEMKLKRDIQVFYCTSAKELIALGPNLLRNILKGNLIKGDLDFIEVKVHA